VGPRGPHRFRVVWGDSFRNVTQDIVLALDVDEALTVADEHHPELPRLRAAFFASETD